jgi:pimeloyl-ACP methyl ester carboxylesterase
MSIAVFNLLGGLWGWDGVISSIGMMSLGSTLNAIPGVTCENYLWTDYENAKAAIRTIKPFNKIVIIGYSGGGSRATWLVNEIPIINVDLMVLYDPSPSWQMKPINWNVKRAICFHNTNPAMFGLGGGVLVGKPVTTINISEQHLGVQFDQTLHSRTIAAIKELQHG